MSPVRTPTRTGRGFAIQPAPDLFQRCAQVALDIVVQAPQWRHVHTPQPRREHPHRLIAEQSIEDRQEGRQSLAGARRRYQENVFARRDRRPCQTLRGCRPFRKRIFKPGARDLIAGPVHGSMGSRVAIDASKRC